MERDHRGGESANQASSPDRIETIDRIRAQAEAFDEAIVQNEDNDAALVCGAETRVGLWSNTTFETFIDAACDVSEFKRGRYEATWEWIADFYRFGQEQ
mmetsp:Transcript_101404/g.286061  ORF Transcript_101404/g.286061 Transcript_101404/m.286061 type:complete len:99 (-) Transcript_101404:62-358(-)